MSREVVWLSRKKMEKVGQQKMMLRIKRREGIVIVLLLIIIFVLENVKLYLDNMTINEVYIYEDNLVKIERLKDQNLILQTQLLNEQSLSTIEARARRMGFIEGKVFYLP